MLRESDPIKGVRAFAAFGQTLCIPFLPSIAYVILFHLTRIKSQVAQGNNWSVGFPVAKCILFETPVQ
jgi:hypothetical protein